MRRYASGWSLVLVLLSSAAIAEPKRPAGNTCAPGGPGFVMHRVGTFRGEACDVGDFNGDGKLDIVAGPYVYLAPEFKSLEIRKLEGTVDEQGKGYCHDFMNLPLDVDGDGRLDVVSCFWHEKKCSWFRNPGVKGRLWEEKLIEQNGNFECGDLWDIDGDGRALEILPHVQRTVWYERGKLADGTPGMVAHLVSEKPITFGGGVGDVNGDGRPDILRPGAWYEAPADPRKGSWKEHPLALGDKDEKKVDHTAQIVVYDVNGDGRNDILASSAHKYGIWWYEQTGDRVVPQWKRHLIDDSWTQAHSITLVDMNGDGVKDFVTGKRFMAHNGHDPEEFSPLGVYWYELTRGTTPKWTKHVICSNEGIGAALNIPVVDLDGDGDLDVVVTGKFGGPVWFENKAK